MSSLEEIDYKRNIKEEQVESTGSSSSPAAHEELHDVTLEDKCELTEEEKKLGTIVTKPFDGTTYMGSVVGYDPANKLFLVLYENGMAERVDKEEFEQMVAHPALVDAYLDFIEKRKNITEGKGTRLFVEYYITIINKTEEPKPKTKPKPKPKPKKTKKIRRASDYVPLVYREKKRDLYYWY